MCRAGIYLFYDRDGIVDGYVDYFLKELKTVVDYLVVVVNGKLTPEGRKKFSELSDDFFVRKNEGYDVWAYHDAIEYIGFENLTQYDELVITNSTIFGPLYSFKEIFSRMKENPCDWWGMQRRYEDKSMTSFLGKKLIHGYMPEFPLSNFWVIRKNILTSYEFRKYWSNIPPIKSYVDTCIYHEPVFTVTMNNAGFIFDTYDGQGQRNLSSSPTVMSTYQQVSQLQVPIVRWRLFSNEYSQHIMFSKGEEAWHVIQYIQSHTNYDINLIWEYILRHNNMYDLKNNLHLNKILSTTQVTANTSAQKMRVAVVLHIYYMELFDYCARYIRSFPQNCDVYLITNTDERMKTLQSITQQRLKDYHTTFIKIQNRGRDVSALLIGARDVVCSGDYDLVCFMHDKKVAHLKWSQTGIAFSNNCYENVAATPEYVQNVIGLFSTEPRLGLASPPPPSNGEYYKVVGGSWSSPNNFQGVKKILQELNMSVPIDVNKPPVAPYGSVFWFRCDALRPLFEKGWNYEDFTEEPIGVTDGDIMHAIERVYPFVAQGQGYYSSVIFTQERAELEITHMTFETKEYLGLFRNNGYNPNSQNSTEFRAGYSNWLKQQSDKSTSLPIPQNASSIVRDPAKKPYTLIKHIARELCPIGIWNILRRIKYFINGDVYVRQKVSRSIPKCIARMCVPRFIWENLRKIRYKKKGWVYIPED